MKSALRKLRRGMTGIMESVLPKRTGRDIAPAPPEGLKALGRKGEREAYRFLRKQGYRIVARNFSSFSGEIDLVGWDRDILCFVEVKTRTTEEHGRPEAAVNAFKQRQILNTARDFLRQANLHPVNIRFDIVSIRYSEERDAPECRLIRRAFGGAAR